MADRPWRLFILYNWQGSHESLTWRGSYASKEAAKREGRRLVKDPDSNVVKYMVQRRFEGY
jgi:hypothetical protein